LTPAKAQSAPSSEGRDELSWRTFRRYFPGFAAFAPLREIFRVLVAALPRWSSEKIRSWFDRLTTKGTAKGDRLFFLTTAESVVKKDLDMDSKRRSRA